MRNINKLTVLKNFTTVIFLLITSVSYSQNSDAGINTADNSAKIVFMRSTGYNGSAVAFTTFIDNIIVCKLNNKRFSTHIVSPGEHNISVQFAGKNSKEKAERINVKTEAGKTYYIQLIFQPGAFINNLYCQEVTESSANHILPKLKEDTKCL